MIFLPLYYGFNSGIDNNKFPDTLKIAEIKPSFKQDDRQNKGNYRPVSLLPVISKVYVKVLYGQINEYFETILSPLQCGFRKGHGVQHCLLALVEKWRHALDKKQSAGLLTTDLSKAFDCIRHDLLIAKLHAYGVSIKSIRYMYDYLSNRKQRVRIKTSYSAWTENMECLRDQYWVHYYLMSTYETYSCLPKTMTWLIMQMIIHPTYVRVI